VFLKAFGRILSGGKELDRVSEFERGGGNRGRIAAGLLGIFLAVAACESCRIERSPNSEAVKPKSQVSSEYRVIKTNADIAQLTFVNKRCRLWGADGDIDVDQTCLVVRTVKGGLIVIPNEYADAELKEVLEQMGNATMDKWLQRFYDVGGGEKNPQVQH
jgi:hypothetical protein